MILINATKTNHNDNTNRETGLGVTGGVRWAELLALCGEGSGKASLWGKHLSWSLRDKGAAKWGSGADCPRQRGQKVQSPWGKKAMACSRSRRETQNDRHMVRSWRTVVEEGSSTHDDEFEFYSNCRWQLLERFQQGTTVIFLCDLCQ